MAESSPKNVQSSSEVVATLDGSSKSGIAIGQTLKTIAVDPQDGTSDISENDAYPQALLMQLQEQNTINRTLIEQNNILISKLSNVMTPLQGNTGETFSHFTTPRNGGINGPMTFSNKTTPRYTSQTSPTMAGSIYSPVMWDQDPEKSVALTSQRLNSEKSENPRSQEIETLKLALNQIQYSNTRLKEYDQELAKAFDCITILDQELQKSQGQQSTEDALKASIHDGNLDEALLKTIAEQETKVTSLEKENKELLAVLKERTEQANATILKVAKLNNELMTKNENYSIAVDKLTQEVMDLKLKNDKQRDTIDIMESSNIDSEKQAYLNSSENAKQFLDDLDNEIEYILTTNNNREELMKLKQENLKLQADFKATSERSKVLSKENDGLRKKNTQMITQMKSFKRKILGHLMRHPQGAGGLSAMVTSGTAGIAQVPGLYEPDLDVNFDFLEAESLAAASINSSTGDKAVEGKISMTPGKMSPRRMNSEKRGSSVRTKKSSMTVGSKKSWAPASSGLSAKNLAKNKSTAEIR
mmetsp:Transcript_50706/g.58139  ORF Transcript_50706/g.58139 Transcript_50706/m.58139 type:complete len:530 (-) Transcript_50706:152-1741(-)